MVTDDGAIPFNDIADSCVQYSPDLGPVAFITHQWLGFYNADPEFEQLGALQAMMHRILSGDITSISGNTHVYIAGEPVVLTQRVLLTWVSLD